MNRNIAKDKKPESFVLNTGRRLPPVGFGTWQLTPDHTAQRLVEEALRIGYRLIDTARIYGNEKGVGAAIRESDAPRRDIVVSSKVWNDDQGYDRTLQAFEASLERLGLDYIDIYLIHWPATSKRHDSWRALERLYGEGRIKAAGVSNFTVRHLEDLAQHAELVPAVNQVEFHPFIYRQQRELVDYCRQHGIVMQGYSPLNRISSEDHEPVQRIAGRYGKTPQQIVLRWCLQHGVMPLVRSFRAEHIASDWATTDFVLDEKAMAALDDLSDGRRVTWDPAGMG